MKEWEISSTSVSTADQPCLSGQTCKVQFGEHLLAALRLLGAVTLPLAPSIPIAEHH